MRTSSKFKMAFLTATLGITVAFSSFASFLVISSDIAEINAWSGTQTSSEGTYYEEARGLSGSALKSSLDTIISRNVSTSYNWTRYEAADEAENDSSKVLQIYTRTTIAKTAHVSGSLGWNREHTYPDSKITSPADADNLHIFASDNKVNGTRGNKLFGIVTPKDASTDVQDSLGNTIDAYTNSTLFEPPNAAKGEVARATLYLNTAYGYSITGNFTSESLCLDWAKNYPVTNREIYRNNTVYSLQGNRNPYIDHPEFIDMVYDPSYSGSGALNDTGESVEPTSLSLSPSSATIGIGGTQSLSVSALPSGASTAVTWSTSNSSIATVNNGVVTGVANGTATITATSTLKTSVTATASITVTNISVTGVSLVETASIGVGNTTTLTPVFSPANATNKTATWSSSNTSVASINSTSGLITGIAVGTSTITVTTQDGNFTDTCLLTVSEQSSHDVTYTISAKNTLTASGTVPSGTTSSIVETYSTTQQITGGNSQTLTLSGWNGITITAITLSMKSNSSSGAGNFTYSVDGGSNFTTLIATASFNDSSWNGAWSTSFVPIEINDLNVTASTSDLVFKLSATANSLYCESYSFTYESGVQTKTLSNIAITSQPSNKTYYDGDSFDTTGLIVTATYSDSSTAIVTDLCMFAPNPLTEGTTTITVSYSEGGITKTASISGISVLANNVASIAIKTPATSTAFTLGSVFSSAGLVITVTYDNASTSDLSSGFDVTGVNTSVLGSQTATITYAGKTASYNVTITNNGASVSTSANFATDLFISEYIEASPGNDKLLEIYNGTGTTVNLDGYSINLYSNGSSTASSTYAFSSSASLTNNSVFSIVNAGAVAAYKVGTYVESVVTYFNGNDAIALLKNGVIIDLIGVIGVDPSGGAWTGNAANGLGSTADMTLRRTSDIASPNATFTMGEWNAYANQQSSDVGIHTFIGGEVSGNVTSDEQAIAWATYFLDLTDETCQAMSGNFDSDWTILDNEYGYMASSSKDTFVNNSTSNATITAAIERYQFIINKYQLENFITDGNGVEMTAVENRLTLNAYNDDWHIIIAITVLLSSTLMAFFFVEKKKRALK